MALVKSQKKMKRQVDRSRKEAEEYRVDDKVVISTKDFSMELMKRVTKKLIEKFIGPYCYKLKSLDLDERTNLILSNTRELDRKLFYKLVYLI